MNEDITKLKETITNITKDNNKMKETITEFVSEKKTWKEIIYKYKILLEIFNIENFLKIF